jgi:LysM repeat protein
VTAAALKDIFQDQLHPETAEKYFRYAYRSQFLENDVEFKVKPRPTAGDPASAAFFPMIPALKLAAGDNEFDFGSDRTISKKYEEWVDEYFNDLAVDFANQVERDPDGRGDGDTAQAVPVEETVATYVFRKYFQLLTRGVVQAGLDLLRNFPYEVSEAARTSLASIAAKFPKGELSYAVRAGDSLASIAAAFEVGEAAIEAANPNVDFGNLKPGEEIVIPIAVTPARIVIANQTATGILHPWGETRLATAGTDADGRERPTLSGIRYQARAGDTLDSIAKRFGIQAKDLAEANLDTDGLFRDGAEVKAGDLEVTTRDGDTLQSLARYYGITVDALLKANKDAGIALKTGQRLVVETGNGNESYTVQDGDTLAKIADKKGSTTDSILSLNDALRVAGGQKIAVKAAALKAGDTVVVHHNTAKGDTLDSILKAFFGKSTDTLKQLLRQWNPDVDFGQLEPGTPLEFPYVVTFRNLTRYFGVELSTIVAANTDAGDVLAQRAAITVPPIQPEVKADDSFTSLAQRYALSLSRLAELLADCKGIFRDSDEQNGPVELTSADVPA